MDMVLDYVRSVTCRFHFLRMLGSFIIQRKYKALGLCKPGISQLLTSNNLFYRNRPYPVRRTMQQPKQVLLEYLSTALSSGAPKLRRA